VRKIQLLNLLKIKNMKRLIILIQVMILIGCDNRKDPFESSNQSPVLLIKASMTGTGSASVADTVKIGKDYTLYYNIKDDQNNTKPQMSVISGTMSIKETRDSSLVLTGFSSGVNQASISAVDCYEKVSSVSLKITAIENMAPVAAFTITKIGGNTVTLDASASYDQDKKWGGAVVLYEFKANDDSPVQQALPVLSKNLLKNNNVIVVRVQDNDGTWSAENTQYITVP